MSTIHSADPRRDTLTCRHCGAPVRADGERWVHRDSGSVIGSGPERPQERPEAVAATAAAPRPTTTTSGAHSTARRAAEGVVMTAGFLFGVLMCLIVWGGIVYWLFGDYTVPVLIISVVVVVAGGLWLLGRKH